jgi:hypothetical protein
MHKLSIDSKVSIFSKIVSSLKKLFGSDRSMYKTHDYSQDREGIDYFIEPAQNEPGWYLTSHGRVKKGDRIILQQEGRLRQYQIEEIDRYSDRPDLFISLLKELD